MQPNTTNPGIYKHFKFDYFDLDEKKIIQTFSKEWYVTASFKESLGNSIYKAFLIKPTEKYKEAFNLDREVVVVFSPYSNFEPRTFSMYDKVISNLEDMRTEDICSIIISKANDVEHKVKEYLKTNQETQVVVPFTYDEIISCNKFDDICISRFRDYFYGRDLFAFESPLRKDIYFFGRTNIVHSIVNRHISGENSGVFGLRKSGKTSVIYSVQRVLDKKRIPSALFDCESLHFKQWNHALKHIVEGIKETFSLKKDTKEEDYSLDKAPESFEREFDVIFNKIGRKPILLIFDEVEHITPGISISDTWKSGDSFVKFWQIIRSIFQRKKQLTYLLSGTNPKCVEIVSAGGVDNPIFSQIPFDSYIDQFDHDDVKSMVVRLGKYMGLEFDTDVIAYLTREYGGHPFLIRHVCSIINSLALHKPHRVNRLMFQQAKERFENERGTKYSEMILEVLKKYYNDEFCMLEFLSTSNITEFNEFAKLSPEYTAHLLGYGIIEKVNEAYDFRIDMLKRYLNDKNKYKKIGLSKEEKQKEISERRNKIEPLLRKIVRMQLIAKYGEEKATEIISKYSKDKNIATRLTYKDYFDPTKCNILFSELTNAIKKYWEDCFRYIFNSDLELFSARMTLINTNRKADAHAASISDADMDSFRGAMTWLEEKIKAHLE